MSGLGQQQSGGLGLQQQSSGGGLGMPQNSGGGLGMPQNSGGGLGMQQSSSGGLGMQHSSGSVSVSAQSLLSQSGLQSGLQSSLQSHLNLGGNGGSSSPQSSLGGQSSQTLFQHNKVNLGQSGGGSGGFGGTSLGNFGQNSLSSHLFGLGQSSLPQSGFGGLGQQNMGQQSLGQPNLGQQVLGQQVMDTQGLNQQSLGKQGLGQQSLGQQNLGQQGLGGQGLGAQGLGQQSLQTSSNPNFMANFDQASSSMNQNQFPKDIEDEANSYFQQIIITKSIPINKALDMLKQFQSSSDKRETDVFSCMLHALFEEYKFFNQYPEQELYITGKLFGGIIERGLVTFVPLGYALRIILDSLQFPPSSKMFMFGIHAIDEFKQKLKDYPQYCRFLKEKNPNYKDFPPRLLEYIEHGAEAQEPPSTKFSAAQQSQQAAFTGASSGIQNMQQQQSPFPSMFGNQGNYTQNNQTMFGQNNSGSLFNSTPPSSSPANQMTSFNLQSILNNPAAAAVTKGTIGSSLGNIGSSLGNNTNFPPASSPNVMPHQGGQGVSLPAPQGRSTPTRTTTPQGGWSQADLQQQPTEDKKVSLKWVLFLEFDVFSPNQDTKTMKIAIITRCMHSNSSQVKNFCLEILY